MTAQRAHPLQWPQGWSRTQSPGRSKFNTTMDKATRGLLNEIRKLGGRLPVISSNAQYKQDGTPYARQSVFDDTGVAVYFERKGKPMVFACDRYWTLHDNIWAIAKTIEALRAIERWGASDMMERAFTGFTALPPPSAARGWREVLEYGNGPATEAWIQFHYRNLVGKKHPDKGGSHAAMVELNAARDAALLEAS